MNRSRGLCWRCFYTPGVRELYLSESKYARRGVGMEGGDGLGVPTGHRPGTAGKLAVMGERAAAGLCLFHPGDAE